MYMRSIKLLVKLRPSNKVEYPARLIWGRSQTILLCLFSLSITPQQQLIRNSLRKRALSFPIAEAVPQDFKTRD